ncbi:MATE family efflux transporter [Brachybacterium huguangmaarense]|uniref:MATE family efflux transporter n=1 Tax=Brachybacterium huguangmaarense TaxID=1652028 RepID=A0ABY6G0R5_9MICO|nr:lipid II flippase MurJ [Brachybacterium huguangmaarense]UYG16554.1 MATE family efflux transporter [Brachybacterium huguangmaarense]
MSAPAAPRSSATVRGIARAAGLILVVTIVARIAGFVRYLVFGATVGAGDVGTAYASANLLPNVLFEVVAGGALAGAVIPLVAGLIEHDEDGSGARRASRVISALMGWMLLVTVPLAILVALLAHPIASLILGGDASGPGAILLGARMLRIFAVQIPLYGVTVLLGAFLQARRRFLWPALVPLVSSLVVMASYAVYAALSPAVATVTTISPATEAVLAWGTTAGVLMMALPLVIPARRAGLRLIPTLRFPEGTARQALGLAGAGLGAVGAQQAASALILLLAMRAGGTGTLPVFQYAQAVYLLPYAVLVVPLVTSVFPHLSELRLVGDADGFARAGAMSLRSVVAVAAAGGAVLFAAAPAIEQFFRLLDRAGATGVGSTVAALSLGLAPYAVATQSTRILSAAMRARDALVVGSVGWVCAAVLILLIVLPSATRRTAEASTAFGLCIALGMSVAALVGLSRLGDVLGQGPLRRGLFRGSALSVLAYVLAAVAGYAACRALMRAGAHMPLTILAGVVGGLAALVVVAVVLGLGDRETLRQLRRGRTPTRADTAAPVPAGPEQ